MNELTPTARSPLEAKLARARGLLLSVSLLALGLFGLLVFLVVSQGRAFDIMNPVLRSEAVARLVEQSTGLFDSFPDPDVGRILLPGLQERPDRDVAVSTNAFGWRERPVTLPKPADLCRVVILGDSFVFAPGAPADQRMGSYLESYLRERSGAGAKRVEVVHLGVGSWNIQAETAYLRRSLASLQPDLVVQIVVSNDLDDSGSARGFGAVADFTSQHPEHTVVVWDHYPIYGLGLGFKRQSYLNAGLGYEGRQRYLEATARLAALAEAVSEAGGSYLLLVSWEDEPAVAWRHFRQGLPERGVVFLPQSFRSELRNRISKKDPHWNPAGHDHLAKFLYGALRDRHLLSELGLGGWPEAEEIFRTVNRQGLAEAEAEPPPDASRQIDDAVDFSHLNQRTAPQIDVGVDKEGLVSPYAAVLLRRGDGRRIEVHGEALAARTLRGKKVRIWADEVELGAVELAPGRPIDLSLPLPPPLLGRSFFDLRFAADDWVYSGPELRHCVTFRLRSVAVSK